ncbi:MAG: ABC transporter ATP-binding protein [Caloramator sp.]|nr:ABC transporter ATP-binding protein [Caloramator sp.]
MRDTAINIKNLSFSFGKEIILDDIGLEIKKGYFYSIIGPNGSGKTTLIKHISRIIMPPADTIFVQEKDVTEYFQKDFAKKLSLVPQEIEGEHDFTAYEIVLMGRYCHLKMFEGETKKDKEIALWAMKVTNTLHIKDKPFKNLSGGEKQRVIISRALAQESDIVILDEPISHLDINYQIEVLDLLLKLKEELNITILCVLHDLNMAAQYSDYIIAMKNGKIIKIGNPKEVINKNLIKALFNLEVSVFTNPINNRPFIIPLSKFTQIG